MIINLAFALMLNRGVSFPAVQSAGPVESWQFQNCSNRGRVELESRIAAQENVAPPPPPRQQASLKHKLDGDDAEERANNSVCLGVCVHVLVYIHDIPTQPLTAATMRSPSTHALPKLVGSYTRSLLHPPPRAATAPYGTTLLESTAVASSVLAVYAALPGLPPYRLPIA
ncbi:hypothetical protein C8J57DRAFT_1679041 [Mycena rebaudengoi]|nr:hypothetical protein C8J57DRAFT_1679041 [Mycena rebaudengoi]